jgi:hypothetical protein
VREKRFTIRDLLALVTIIAVLFAIGVPAILRARAMSRRVSCSNNFKQIMLAIHNYHSAYKHLPSAMGGTGVGLTPRDGNANRLSGLISLLPFCLTDPTWEMISNPRHDGGIAYPPMGPVPWDKNYAPWKITYHPYICPSDTRGANFPDHPFGRTNAVFCIGDSVRNIHKPKPLNEVRGMFAPRHVTKFRNVINGLANTIAMTETATAQGRRVSGQFAVGMPASVVKTPQDCLNTLDSSRRDFYATNITLSDLGRGGNWADGAGGYSLMQTILPPNSPSCAIGGTAEVDGIFSASSRHPGGCHVAMGDGRVIFVTDTIECGDSAVSAPLFVSDASTWIESPYGLWGALGTRASKEVIETEYGR